MNQHNPSFARSLPPRVAAEGRSLVVPPPGGAPATIPYQQQTGTGTERGRARGVMCRFALAVAQDWSVIRGRAGSSLPRTCRSLHGFRPFSGATRLGGNRALAINIKTTRCGHFECVSQRLPSHSKAPVPSPHDHEAKGVGSDQKAIGVSQNVVDC